MTNHLTWTTEKPVADGYYWVRAAGERKIGPLVCEVTTEMVLDNAVSGTNIDRDFRPDQFADGAA